MLQNHSTKKSQLKKQIRELEDMNIMQDDIIRQNENTLLLVIAENIYLKTALSALVLKPIDQVIKDAQPLLDLFIREIRGNNLEYLYNNMAEPDMEWDD